MTVEKRITNNLYKSWLEQKGSAILPIYHNSVWHDILTHEASCFAINIKKAEQKIIEHEYFFIGKNIEDILDCKDLKMQDVARMMGNLTVGYNKVYNQKLPYVDNYIVDCEKTSQIKYRRVFLPYANEETPNEVFAIIMGMRYIKTGLKVEPNE